MRSLLTKNAPLDTMRMGKELFEALTVLPSYDESIRQLSASERLIALTISIVEKYR